MKDYRRKKKLSLKEVVERLGEPLGNYVFSSLVSWQGKVMGKALLDGKVVESEVSKYEEISGMYVRTYIRKPRKYNRNSVKTDVDDRGWWMHRSSSARVHFRARRKKSGARRMHREQMPLASHAHDSVTVTPWMSAFAVYKICSSYSRSAAYMANIIEFLISGEKMTRGVLHVWSEILQFFQPREKWIFTKNCLMKNDKYACRYWDDTQLYLFIFFFFFEHIYNYITLYI